MPYIPIRRYPDRPRVSSTDTCPRCSRHTEVELVYAQAGGIFILGTHIGGENLDIVICNECGLHWQTGTIAVACIRSGHFSWRDNLLYSDIDGQLRGLEYGVHLKKMTLTRINTPLSNKMLEQLEAEFEENFAKGGNDPCRRE